LPVQRIERAFVNSLRKRSGRESQRAQQARSA